MSRFWLAVGFLRASLIAAALAALGYLTGATASGIAKAVAHGGAPTVAGAK